ncbi:hypothetical protein Tco_0458049 [Tanacetum coccineum]
MHMCRGSKSVNIFKKNLLFHDWESDLKECEGMICCTTRVFVEYSYTCLRTVSTSENDSSYKYLYEFDESHEALHIFRDIFQKSSEHSDLNFRCVLNKFHKHIECFSNHVFANRSSTRTASIRKSDTSVLEDLKALSWKTCQEGITSITVNGKNTYELKGKFLDDLNNNAFSGTNGEDAVEHIEYFLKIVDPIDLLNVNQYKLRIVVFPISLVGDAWRWFDGIKESITSWVDLTDNFFGKYYPPSRTGKVNTLIIKWDPTNPEFENWLASKFVNYMTMDIFTKGALWDYWKLGSEEIKPTNEETSDLEETDHDDEQEIEWPTCSWREDGYCNGGNLTGTYIVGNSLHYQDLEWYKALKDSELKEEALRNKAIMEGLINEDVESNNEGWRSWEKFKDTNTDHYEREYKIDQENEERCELFDDTTQELPVCTVRRFEMIKYSSGQDEEYVALKEEEYEDLTSTSEDACRAYQEIFRMMDE